MSQGVDVMNAWVVPGYTESTELGAGASGRVVLAVHDATGTPVAVKYLGEKFRADSRFLLDFRKEARLLGGLDSPHVTGLYEYVEAPQGAAIVMELVDGIALRALLRMEGTTGPEAALVVLKGSLLGLAAAHRAGVVHRDYKPENVLVAQDGSSKLVDFGIAVRSGTTPGVAGTPLYMAPEQWNGEPASPAADVYAATATFYECLTGEKPYSGENFAELALAHISARIPDERAPEPVRPLIRRGLAKEPGQRPENATAFVEELEEVAGAAYGKDWEERGQRRLAALAALLPLLFPSAGGGAAGATALATTELPGRGLLRRPGLRDLLTAVGALLLTGVLTYTAVATGDADPETAAETVATTSAVPGDTTGPTGGPSGSGDPTPSASPSESPTGSVSPSGTPTDGPTAGTSPPAGTGSEPSASAGPTTYPSSGSTPTPTSPAPSAPTPPVTSDPPPAPPKVTYLAVTSLRQTGPTSAAASVAVTTSGPGPVTLTVSWYSMDGKGTRTPEGRRTFQLSGQTQYTRELPDLSFQNGGCYWYWGVLASTEPASPRVASQQIPTLCDLR